MYFLLDTNILIPLDDSKAVLNENLRNFFKLATENQHKLCYHPASEEDIKRDTDVTRRESTLSRIRKYHRLERPPLCTWNTAETDPNDAVDNEILYAIERNVAHFLVAEDKEIHKKAKIRGLSERIFHIQTAEDFLRRLYTKHPISLPNIEEIYVRECDARHQFFDSLRSSYGEFDTWFASIAMEQRKAWIYGTADNPEAMCIFKTEQDTAITDDNVILRGQTLKLCTFKVSETVRGRKIGELFLKAAFRYATKNRYSHIYLTLKEDEHKYLVDLIEDFGFELHGCYRDDKVYLKRHPIEKPERGLLDPYRYLKSYFPHFRDDESVSKLIVPIKPHYHGILFPDFIDKTEPFQPLLPLNMPYTSSVGKVQRLMRQLGIQAIYAKPNTSQPHPKHPIYPYLLKGLEINRSN